MNAGIKKGKGKGEKEGGIAKETLKDPGRYLMKHLTRAHISVGQSIQNLQGHIFFKTNGR